MEKSPYLCSAISNQNTMITKKTTPYYLIIEVTGNLAGKNVPKVTTIRGLYSTQAKAIAELFHIATRYHDDGAMFCDIIQDPPEPLSQLIHSQTHNGETSIMGYIPKKLLIFNLQIRPITLDICSLITT